MKIPDFNKSNDEEYSSPKERIPMIKEVFQLVLNREPSSRELSFYKYGIQGKQEITDKLLSEDEHKDALERSKEFSNMEDRAKNAEHKVKKLNQNIEDYGKEEIQLKSLLAQKNREIAILRRETSDPYNFTHSQALKYIQDMTSTSRENTNSQSQNDNTYSTLNNSSQNIPTKESFIDKIYKMLKLS